MDKIIYYTGCFANYYDPEIAKSLLFVLERNNIDVVVSKQLCCGMPMMANGNYKGAERNFKRIVEALLKESEGRYDIITTCPSCNMMLKKEGREFFKADGSEYLLSHLYDSSEYILKLLKEKRLKAEFAPLRMRVLYHNPCHLKVQKIDATIQILSSIPDLEIVGINRDCCGMGGSFGMKKKNYDISSKIGMKIWRMVETLKPDGVVTECGGCGLQIRSKTGVKIYHPLLLLKIAYEAEKLPKIPERRVLW